MAAISAPVPHTAIDNGFRPTGPNSHTGVDYPVAVGEPILSPCDGTVTAVGSGRYWGKIDLGWDYGRWVVIHDGNGNDNHLAHFGTVQVKKGQKVKRGQEVGLGGRSGAETGPHCHWAVYSPFPVRSTLKNPATYLAEHPNTAPVNVGPVTPVKDPKETTMSAPLVQNYQATPTTNHWFRTWEFSIEETTNSATAVQWKEEAGQKDTITASGNDLNAQRAAVQVRIAALKAALA